jgi:dUTP pyrophosphatase
MNVVKVKIVRLNNRAILPEYQTEGAAAMDIHACIEQPITIGSLERMMIPTGFSMEIPVGYEIQIRARSGLSIKHGITMINGIGTIDADYRGELGVLLVNMSRESFVIEPDMRIAQMVIAQCDQIVWDQVDSLSETERGERGYGSTGIIPSVDTNP